MKSILLGIMARSLIMIMTATVIFGIIRMSVRICGNIGMKILQVVTTTAGWNVKVTIGILKCRIHSGKSTKATHPSFGM